MSTTAKVFLILAAVFTTVGLAISAFAIFALRADPEQVGSVTFVESTVEESGDFKDIVITDAIGKVRFVEGVGEGVVVKMCTTDDYDYRVEVTDGKLEIVRRDTSNWYEKITPHISFGFETEKPYVIVELPDTDYEDLSVVADAGEVKIDAKFSFENVTVKADAGAVRVFCSVAETLDVKTDAGAIEIASVSPRTCKAKTDAGAVVLRNVHVEGDLTVESDAGALSLSSVEAQNITTKTDAGKQTLSGVVATDKLGVTSDTGNVEMEGADSAVIDIRVDVGNVQGTLKTGKVFDVEVDVGRARVPDDESGHGTCKVRVDVGQVNLRVTG